MEYEIKEALEKQNRAIAALASMVMMTEKALIMLISNAAGCIETQITEHAGKKQDQKTLNMIDATYEVFFESEKTVRELWDGIFKGLGLEVPQMTKYKNIDKLIKGEFLNE